MNVQIISGFLVLFSFIFGQTQFLRQDLFAIEDISIRKRSTMLVFNYFSVLISVEFFISGFFFFFWFTFFTSTLYNKNHQSKNYQQPHCSISCSSPGSLIHPPLDNQSSFSFQTTRVAGLFVHNKGFLECVCLIAFSRTCTFKLTPTSL